MVAFVSGIQKPYACWVHWLLQLFIPGIREGLLSTLLLTRGQDNSFKSFHMLIHFEHVYFLASIEYSQQENVFIYSVVIDRFEADLAKPVK